MPSLDQNTVAILVADAVKHGGMTPEAGEWLKEAMAREDLDVYDKKVCLVLAMHMDENGIVEATDEEVVGWLDEMEQGVLRMFS